MIQYLLELVIMSEWSKLVFDAAMEQRITSRPRLLTKNTMKMIPSEETVI